MSINELTLDIHLSVLDDLGLRLYSSTPAVLSEIVANAWDADATMVRISIDSTTQEITVKDNGEGMTFEEAQARFLTVGYKRRLERPGTTIKFHRPVMGRKGIGKLAPLAIADRVEVDTRKDGRRIKFVLDVPKIREDIAHNQKHKPKILINRPTNLQNGTILTISQLKRQIQWAEPALRKRLARRFAVIGDAYDFRVKVNKDFLTSADVDYYKKIEFAWNYGLSTDDPNYRKLESPPEWENRGENFVDLKSETTYKFSGWIGTVKKPADLEDNQQKIGGIAIFARGKLAHEDATSLVGDDHLFTKYLVGEIEADFLDRDDQDDIATSNRQSLLEDDARVDVLRQFIIQELKHINSKWSELRNLRGEQSVDENPGVKQYLDTLKPEKK